VDSCRWGQARQVYADLGRALTAAGAGRPEFLIEVDAIAVK
jgi:hypothetical protein